MAGTMALYPESPLDPDDVVYPCKGCGEILEEGKAFELAGHRWHLECFKCNTCHTILDSDANLLLLGDGSLICNNCTYSCNACGNKIQDLAILTGDQAYCAACFRCRNCKKKIENLRYARTSQGMFCMDCHDALMARRRKKTKNAAQRLKQQGSHMLLDKSLPSLPPNAAIEGSSFSPDSGGFSGPSTPTELPAEVPARRGPASRTVSHEVSSSAPQELDGNDSLAAPVRPSNRTSTSEASDGDGMMISLQLDPSLVATPPVEVPSNERPVEMDVRPPSGSDYFNRNGDTSRRPAQEPAKVSATPSNARTSAQTSPRTSLKDAGRNVSETRLDVLNSTSPRVSADRSRDPSPLVPPPRREPEQERFKLQEAPPGRKKSIGARDAILSPRAAEIAGDSRRPGATTPQAQSSGASTPQADITSPSFSQSNAQDLSASSSSSSHPKRGDSLLAGKANSNQVIQRKEVGGVRNPSSQPASGGVDSPSSSSFAPSSGPNGGLVIGKPIESPMSKSFMDYPQKSDKRPVPGSAGGGESFASPRAAPEPDTQRHQRKASASLASGKAAEGPETSPRARTSGDSNDEKNSADQEYSLLKRMSNSVRHARTNSDRTTLRNSRDKGSWPKSPLNGNSDMLANISLSPSLGSPDSVSKDAEYYKSQLQAQRQRSAEKDKKIAELLEMVEGPKTTIKQMNTELREKRSTMVVLDTQKEIVVRELELLQPMAAAKKSGEGPDISKSTPAALKDFAAALQKLKDQFAPEIEELMERKSSIQEDIARLTRERDRLQQEFDQLSIVNQRLIDATNENTTSRMAEQNQVQAQGLGIYGPTGDRLKDVRPPSSETLTTNSTLVQDLHAEEPVVITPQVVDVRKNNRAKFNWKKGQIVAKTVGRNLKDAFSSDRSQHMEYQNGAYPSPQNLEGTPYGATQAGQYPSTTLPKDYKIGGEGPDRQGAIGLFAAQQKGARPGPSPVPGRSTPQSQLSSFAGEPVEPPHKLFGSMLQDRADYEGVDIPCIVVRCVQEVQSRGMDVEGIYRKSGGSAQINEVKAGFEKSNDYDISDVDLDIHAVTSTLKQYFRRLPNPLITFDVYDRLIATAPRAPAQPMMGGGMKGGENGGAVELMSKEERIRKTREALAGLPKAHGATLSFLVFHLAKIRKEEARNLMHSLNLAVVFAPTIMRPVEIAREMLDTPGKNDCVRFMIENCEDLFLRG